MRRRHKSRATLTPVCATIVRRLGCVASIITTIGLGVHYGRLACTAVWVAGSWAAGVAAKGVVTLNTHLPRSILVAVATACVLALVACGGGSTTNVSDGAVGTRVQVGDGAYFDITPQTLKSWLGDKDFLLVNVLASYVGEIESTDKFIPLNDIEARLNELPQRDAKIVVYCRSGATSAKAARELVRLGYSNVWNLRGGMIAWQQAGYPLSSAGGP